MSLTLFLLSSKLFHLVNGIFGARSVGVKSQRERRLHLVSDMEGFVEAGEITFARFLSVLGHGMVVFARAAAQVVVLGMTQTHQASQRKTRGKVPSRNLLNRLGLIHSDLFSQLKS